MDIMGGFFGSRKSKEPKLVLVYHKPPASVSANENALVLMLAGAMGDAQKLGIDPTKVEVAIKFKDNGHEMCFSMSKSS